MLNQLLQKLYKIEANTGAPQGPQMSTIVQGASLDNSSLTYRGAKSCVSYDFTHLSSAGCILSSQTHNMTVLNPPHEPVTGSSSIS